MSSKTQRDDDPALPEFDTNSVEVPSGVDRRTFMMRSAVIGAAAVITGCSVSDKKEQAAAPAPAAAPQKPAGGLSEDLDVVKKAKGPVMTTID